MLGIIIQTQNTGSTPERFASQFATASAFSIRHAMVNMPRKLHWPEDQRADRKGITLQWPDSLGTTLLGIAQEWKDQHEDNRLAAYMGAIMGAAPFADLFNITASGLEDCFNTWKAEGFDRLVIDWIGGRIIEAEAAAAAGLHPKYVGIDRAHFARLAIKCGRAVGIEVAVEPVELDPAGDPARPGRPELCLIRYMRSRAANGEWTQPRRRTLDLWIRPDDEATGEQIDRYQRLARILWMNSADDRIPSTVNQPRPNT